LFPPQLPMYRAHMRALAMSFATLTLLACPAPSPATPARATDQKPTAANLLARDLLKELVEINTAESAGGSTHAADAMARRLKKAGFAEADIHILGPDPRKANLVARFPGTGKKKPLLLLAHLDVVEARREDWSADPFVFLERDGYFYGRGTSDDKDMASIF